MKAIKLKQNSWHYWVATEIGDYMSQGDFCAYLRNLLWGMFCLAFGASVCLAVLYGVVHLFYSGYTCWFTKTCTFDDGDKFILRIGTVILVAVSFLWGCIKYKGWKSDRAYDRKRAAQTGHAYQPGFFELSWSTIKDKTCFKVEFVADNDSKE